MKQKIVFLILILTLLGIADSAYLTYEHYSNSIPPCPAHTIFVDCGKVLRSQYSLIVGVPLALIGLIHYSLFFINSLLGFITSKKIKYLIVIQSIVGAASSVYFMYLQLIVIKSICLYCTFSAVISFTIFTLTMIFLGKEIKQLLLFLFGIFYQNILKRIFFLIDPEFIHELMLDSGESLGKIKFILPIFGHITSINDPILTQKIAGISFKNPVGLAAGFDYEAKLPLVSPLIGFGFQTIGTITNMPYEGNPKPRLGRLPRSKSLMVNKGFKNPGTSQIIRLLGTRTFAIPIGISVGRTNSNKLITQKESVKDIVEAFIKFESSRIKTKYYELNISCPNLYGDVTFYPPKNLKELLVEVQRLKIKKPMFIKMPIEKTNRETLNMLEIISKFRIAGVIIGNLQKNRMDPSLVQDEVQKFKVGNFSGKPTFKRSNELIKLAYKKYGGKLIIIGCGGIFNADDAYTKIKLGATLVQLITGMIFQGPQLVAQINFELVEKLRADGFKHISDAVGVEV